MCQRRSLLSKVGHIPHLGRVSVNCLQKAKKRSMCEILSSVMVSLKTECVTV
jgi:hypothetical protein